MAHATSGPATPRLGRAATSLLTLTMAVGMICATPSHASPSGPVITRLSNVTSSSRWAYPMDEALVRSSPSPHTHSLGRLRYLTADQQAELYLVLASAHLRSGQSWLQVELPGRPNGRTGWVPRRALGSLHLIDGYLHIDERRLQGTLYRDGKAIFSAPVGVGKSSTVTPTGHFYVMEKLRTLNAPAYGPYALGTSAYAPTLSEWPGGGIVGIHGTNEPQLIPGRPSHGCIRMRNSDIAKLWSIIQVGTPILITD
jgi:hypothetical protein